MLLWQPVASSQSGLQAQRAPLSLSLALLFVPHVQGSSERLLSAQGSDKSSVYKRIRTGTGIQASFEDWGLDILFPSFSLLDVYVRLTDMQRHGGAFVPVWVATLQKKLVSVCCTKWAPTPQSRGVQELRCQVICPGWTVARRSDTRMFLTLIKGPTATSWKSPKAKGQGFSLERIGSWLLKARLWRAACVVCSSRITRTIFAALLCHFWVLNLAAWLQGDIFFI